MLRNVMIDTSVGPLVGVTNGNGVVYVNGYQPLPEMIPGIPETLNINHPDQCVGLPNPIPGVFIIVSRVAAEALKIYHRPDIRVPGEPIRDRNGVQIGSVGISHYA